MGRCSRPTEMREHSLLMGAFSICNDRLRRRGVLSTIVEFRPATAVVVLALAFGAITAVSGSASAQQVSRQDIEAREELIAAQETLLNVYRCLFGVDTQVVPDGCTDGRPTRGPTAAGAFEGTPTLQALELRDRLVADQESLLNVYRCLYNTDTHIVPGGCADQGSQTPVGGADGESASAMVRYEVVGSAIRVSWDPVEGADYYNVYYDDFFDSGCRLNRDGSPTFCEELATNLVGTSYVHTDPARDNYYWVVACNRGGCSKIGAEHLAVPIEAIPPAPVDVRYAVVGSAIRVSWDPVEGADYYNVYHDDFFDSGCKLNRDGSPGFCEELATNVAGTTYLHADPDGRQNYYWVVTCNRGGCSEIDADNPARPPGTNSTGPTSVPATGQQLGFAEGESATRSIDENTPAGFNVGAAVSAEVDGALSYTLSGPDAASFTIVPTSGQIRTRDGVVYDYEARNLYRVTVGVADDSGASGAIDVDIHILDLVPACQPLRNLRTNPGDGYLTVKWAPNLQTAGKARVLGYQVEMRRGDGPWTSRRTVLGRSIGATTYSDLENLVRYWFRMRPTNTEGDCGWSPAFIGIPSSFLVPISPSDRFDTRPVGSPDRYWSLVTTDRCRYSVDGVAQDANCQFAATGRDAIRITLEFDDPSRGSCDIALAFSSLTAGSFVDECFDAGVNTETPFDIGFRMPRTGPQTESDIEIPRAPRSKEEFSVLAWGRHDLIPGLHFGCLGVEEVEPDCDEIDVDLNTGYRFARDPNTGMLEFVQGGYTYENTGPSRGVLTFREYTGATYTFTLDFKPSGHVVATVTEEGEPIAWPGLPSLDLGLEALLPIPNSWWEWAAAETDFAPDDIASLEAITSTTRGRNEPQYERLWGDDRLMRTFIGRLGRRWLNPSNHSITRNYDKLGRNRGVLTIDFLRLPLSSRLPSQQLVTYTFDLTFTSDGAALYTLTLTEEGDLPKVVRGIADFNGNSITLDEMPEELTLPAAPPQAAGQDRSGIEIAAAISTPEITGADVQTFLISDQGIQPAAYQPGDWLEPKDGSKQRMMIVGVNQARAAASLAPQPPVSATAAHDFWMSPTVATDEAAVFPDEPTLPPLPLASSRTSAFYDPLRPSASHAATAEPTITQLSVVCMQKDRGIPTRGTRYFSQPKMAEGPTQACQRNCALSETSNIQECVWKCEENG